MATRDSRGRFIGTGGAGGAGGSRQGSAVSLEYEFKDARVRAALGAFLQLAQNPEPIMRGIATIGESSTRERFVTETGPDGARWKPSLRAQLTGGKTLTMDGHLGDSVSSRNDARSAEWGVNRIYGAVHQFGGTIRAKTAKGLRFRSARGDFITKMSVTIPARPYLGVSQGDEADILDLIATKIGGTLDAR